VVKGQAIIILQLVELGSFFFLEARGTIVGSITSGEATKTACK